MTSAALGQRLGITASGGAQAGAGPAACPAVAEAYRPHHGAGGPAGRCTFDQPARSPRSHGPGDPEQQRHPAVGLNDSLPDGATPLCDPFRSPTGLDPPLPQRQRPPRATDRGCVDSAAGGTAFFLGRQQLPGGGFNPAAAFHHRSAASRPGRHQRFAGLCACWLISRCGSLRPTKGFKEAPAPPAPAAVASDA